MNFTDRLKLADKLEQSGDYELARLAISMRATIRDELQHMFPASFSELIIPSLRLSLDKMAEMADAAEMAHVAEKADAAETADEFAWLMEAAKMTAFSPAVSADWDDWDVTMAAEQRREDELVEASAEMADWDDFDNYHF